jgi:glucose/arabinose dehydrogenase
MTDKPEGVAVTPNGSVYVVTDNDGVEDWSGETWFLRLGEVWRLFR